MVLQLYFFSLTSIPSTFAKSCAFISLFAALILSNIYYKRINYFDKPLLCLFLCCFVNMVWCSINRSQSPIEYFIGSEFTSMMGLLTIFAVPAFNMNSKEIEKVLFLLGLLCICIYLFQYFFQIPLTVEKSELLEKGLSVRVRINGQCLFSLLYFKSLRDALYKLTWSNLSVLLLSVLCILILGFRSQIAMLLFLTGIFIWRKSRISFRALIFCSILFFVTLLASQTQIVQFKIQQMQERNESANFQNEDYIRIASYEYYTQELPRNITDRILGCGLPNNNSVYGRQIARVKDMGIVWADWGLIGLSWMLGVPAVLCIAWYCLMAFFTPINKKYSYLCYFFLYMLLASVLTREIYRQGAFPIQGVVLYLIAINKKLDTMSIRKYISMNLRGHSNKRN